GTRPGHAYRAASWQTGRADFGGIQPVASFVARGGPSCDSRGAGRRSSGTQILPVRSQHRHACQQGEKETRRFRFRGPHQDYPRRRLHFCASETEEQKRNSMRSLFLRIFLSFWLALALFLVLAILATAAMRPTRQMSSLEALQPKFLSEAV